MLANLRDSMIIKKLITLVFVVASTAYFAAAAAADVATPVQSNRFGSALKGAFSNVALTAKKVGRQLFSPKEKVGSQNTAAESLGSQEEVPSGNGVQTHNPLVLSVEQQKRGALASRFDLLPKHYQEALRAEIKSEKLSAEDLNSCEDRMVYYESLHAGQTVSPFTRSATLPSSSLSPSSSSAEDAGNNSSGLNTDSAKAPHGQNSFDQVLSFLYENSTPITASITVGSMLALLAESVYAWKKLDVTRKQVGFKNFMITRLAYLGIKDTKTLIKFLGGGSAAAGLLVSLHKYASKKS